MVFICLIARTAAEKMEGLTYTHTPVVVALGGIDKESWPIVGWGKFTLEQTT